MAITPETTLIHQAQNGNTQAFAELYNRTRTHLAKVVTTKQAKYTTHPHRQLTEDIVAETYTRAYAGITTWHDQGKPFIAWLTTIAGNLLLDHLKSAATSRTMTFAQLAAAGTWYDRPDRERDRPEHHAVRTDEFTRLASLIPELTDLQRQVLLNRYYYGLTIEETATEMGMQPGAVKTRCGTAAARLRLLYAAQYPPDPAGAG
jgi:RNA polymerase sigma-70 factor (ECF subfamily)